MNDRGEPIKWVTWKGHRIPIYAKNQSPQLKGKDDLRSAIEDKVRKHFERYWKDPEDDWLRKSDTETMMRHVDECLEYFKKSGQDMIEPSKDYEDEIVWRFSGKDKETGKHAGFEFDSQPDEKNARDNLKGNGYTVSQGLIFPKPLFKYLMDNTNVEDYDIQAVQFVAKQVLADYKRRK